MICLLILRYNMMICQTQTKERRKEVREHRYPFGYPYFYHQSLRTHESEATN